MILSFGARQRRWVNSSSHRAQTAAQLEKLHAIGYKPVLLLGKETKKRENNCEILTPRCTLSTYAQDYLQKIGWNQDSSGNDDNLRRDQGICLRGKKPQKRQSRIIG
ncbi:hypothetical protein PHYPO_G00203030 [Pangasianodon hypophthalmus]|uniref:Uncharacterized protein n=1 Tax=Pangasianodon hypophthalmus TaxID=310915 RepID=A0A5N5PB33_PANHP|nr:hypothetical protein PHYPO_G00203030 [Pangasianodon hypophthalmus]